MAKPNIDEETYCDELSQPQLPSCQEAVKAKYPLGFTEAMIRVDKPNGDFFLCRALSIPTRSPTW